MMQDWFDMSQRLRMKIFEMFCTGKLYGYVWYEVCGNWTVYLVKTKDVYIED